VRYIVEKKQKPVLAVDCDSNACLNEALGVPVHATIGSLPRNPLKRIRSGGERPGTWPWNSFDYQVQQSVIESKGFDLMVMEGLGPGCYCAANNHHAEYTDKLSETLSLCCDRQRGRHGASEQAHDP